jgi:hypothetical protein
MDFLKALDVAIGLIVIYLSFALGVTALNEGLATWLSSRAKWLRRGVAALLGGDAAAGSAFTVKEVYSSPFIKYLGQSTIPWHPAFEPSYLSASALLKGVLDAASGGKGAPLATLSQIEAAAKALPLQSPIRAVIQDLIARANQDLVAFEKLIDDWFKTFEQQVQGWYRQKTQNVIFGLSLLVAVGMNLDTLALSQQLWVDGKLRAALVEKAVELEKSDPVASTEQKKLDQAKAALENARKAEKGVDEAEAAVRAARQALETEAVARIDKLTASGIRIGWDKATFEQVRPWDWPIKLLGLFLSAAALALGAPFWFDLLKRVMAIRAVGLAPSEHEAKEAKAKAP